jgi:fructose-specific phosphotransferase system IIA component
MGGLMEKISGITDPGCIRLELGAGRKQEVIEELLHLLADAGKIDNVARCLSEIMERERISSTGIGNGIAIPHRLMTGVNEIAMAVGRKTKGVPFDAIDGKPAHLIFLIIGPQGRNSEYLKVLSTLSRHLNDRGFFDALMKAKTPDEIVELFKERER